MTLAQWMERRGLNDRQAAEALGATRAAVQRWRLGSRTPRPAQQRVIQRVTRGMVKPQDWIDSLPAVAEEPA